ncbi:MAG: hypothetical protein BWY63_02100 [Chloroflexi bacterium ADurb.Bin360]|nr:MAG: hypothetical protein BWY63_02100 [Chloroflexi bacterium ADurb.Bin360]
MPSLIRVRVLEALLLRQLRQLAGGAGFGAVTQALENRRHLAFDAGDFLQPDGVHLFGREFGGGVAAEAVRVIGGAIRQLPHAVVGGRLLLQGGEVGDELLVGGVDGALDSICGAGKERLAIRLAQALEFGELVAEDGVERVFGSGLAHKRRHLIQHAADNEARREDAPFLADSQPFQHLVEFNAEAVEAFDVVAPLKPADDGMQTQHEGGQLGLDAEHLVDRVIVKAKALAAGFGIEEPLHDVARKAGGGRLPLAVVAPQDAQVALEELENLGLVRHRFIGEFGVVGVDAEFLQDAEHGEQLGTGEGEAEEGAEVEQLHTPGFAPDEADDEPCQQGDSGDDQQDSDRFHSVAPLMVDFGVRLRCSVAPAVRGA